MEVINALLTQAADSVSADPLNYIVQLGILGPFIAILIVYTRNSIKREQERTERAEAQVRELNELIRSEFLPKQVEATILYKQVAEVLGDAVQIISEIKYRDRDSGSDPPRTRRGP